MTGCCGVRRGAGGEGINQGRIIHSQTQQIAALIAERDLLRKVVSDRSAMLITRALNGDQGAKLVLGQLIERLDRIRSGLSRIALPNGGS